MMYNWEMSVSHSMLKWFRFGHLPAHLQTMVVPLADAAETVDALLTMESAEKTAGLRKLLEAKDCFVRAKIEQDERQLG